MEEWKVVRGYKGEYEVSNMGRVKSLKKSKERMLALHQSKLTKRHPKPMYHVELWKDNKRKAVKIHRLVGEHFIPNPQGKPQINHIDGDRTNNRADNLEWVTGSENMLHSYANGLTKPRGRKPVRATNLITGETKEFESIRFASRELLINPDAIRAALKGRSRTSGGYTWEFIH